MSSTQTITVRGYLVVRADGNMRITKTRVSLGLDEIAFPVSVSIPQTWGQVQRTSIELMLPEPPEPRVTVGEPQLDAEAGEEQDV